MTDIQILKRLYNDYTKKFLPKILLSVFFSLIVAGSTAAIAWLLDPAIKKIFIDKDEKLILIIPIIRNPKAIKSKTTNRNPIDANPAILFTGLTTNLLIVSIKLSTDSTKLSSCSIYLILSVQKLLM